MKHFLKLSKEEVREIIESPDTNRIGFEPVKNALLHHYVFKHEGLNFKISIEEDDENGPYIEKETIAVQVFPVEKVVIDWVE